MRPVREVRPPVRKPRIRRLKVSELEFREMPPWT